MNTCYSKMLITVNGIMLQHSCTIKMIKVRPLNLTPVPTQSTLRSFFSAQNAQLHKLPRSTQCVCQPRARLPAGSVSSPPTPCTLPPLGPTAGLGLSVRQSHSAAWGLLGKCQLRELCWISTATRHGTNQVTWHSPRHVQPSRCVACPCTHLRRLVAR